MLEKVSLFSPDSRNLGGRKQIVTLLRNHQNSLEKAKSCLHVKQNSYSAIVRTPSPMYKLYDQFHNVLHTFQKIKEIKHSQSSLLEQKKPIIIKNNRSTNEFTDHLKNVLKSQKRIEALGCLEQRKKNRSDYLIYPTYFYRRIDKKQLKSIVNKSGPFPENSGIKMKNLNKSNVLIFKEDPVMNSEKWARILKQPQTMKKCIHDQEKKFQLQVRSLLKQSEQIRMMINS